MSEYVKLRKDLPGATIRIDRPDSRNALTPDVVSALHQALEDLHGEKKVRGVIVTGTAASFCSGTDLKRLAGQIRAAQTSRDVLQQWHDEVSGMLELIKFMLQFPKPLIAAVNGCSAGTGLALALACDWIIGGEASSWCAPESRRGLVAGLAAPLIAWRTGPATARKMVLTANSLTASQAATAGIIDEVVRDDLVWARANELVEQLAAGAPSSQQLARQLFNETIGESLLVQLAAGAANMAAARFTSAARQGVEAFVNKRPPDWSEL